MSTGVTAQAEPPDDLSIEAFTQLYKKPMHPAVANAREVIELEERIRFATRTDPARRLLRAVRVSPTVHVLEALLRGEPVPKDRLDQRWVKAYGRRRR